MKRYKCITPLYFFIKFYPYKKQLPVSSNTIPVPYIKKSEIIDNHIHSLDWYEWSKIADEYVKVVGERLLAGETIRMDGRLGSFQIVKSKTKKFIDKIKSKEKGTQVFRFKNEYDNYFFYIQWMRKNISYTPNKWIWKCKAQTAFIKKIYDDPSLIYKFNNR